LVRPFDLLREDAVGSRLLLSGRLRRRGRRAGGGRGRRSRRRRCRCGASGLCCPLGRLGRRHGDLGQVRLRPGGLRRGRLRCGRLRCSRWRHGRLRRARRWIRLLSDRCVAYRDEGYCRSAKKQTSTNGNVHDWPQYLSWTCCLIRAKRNRAACGRNSPDAMSLLHHPDLRAMRPT
jgi:hypothetical protein